jgi:hypothetical protein
VFEVTAPRFHLAFPVTDLEEARSFFCGLLGCSEGRSASRWVDFDFFGHQLSAHLRPEMDATETNDVDGDKVPVRHFGLILALEEWHTLKKTLQSKGADFIIEPKVRFEGKPGEQGTMFVRGPSGNALEFKAFRDESRIFAT